MALQTLRSMAGGGIYDQVGGGFSRYSVDARWTVPHFEKMLYDNALLARAYLHGFQASGDALLRRTAEETLDWALREMRAPEGGFYSALDADSEGVEGKFYVWSLDELRAALGDDADAAIAWFGATERGNFEGANILESRGPEPPAEQRDRIRATLLDVARPAGAPGPRRQAPGRLERADDRRAGRRRRGARPRGLPRRRARRARRSCSTQMRTPDGRLLRTYNAGTARLDAYLEDHAFLLEALLVLYEATFEERWFVEARALADTIVARFGDPERGGFFSTPDDHEALIARRKDLEDTPIPSGASSAALGLLRLAALTGEHAYEEQARGPARAAARGRASATRAPSGTCCRRSTSTSRRGARSPWPATRRASRRWRPSSARRAGRTSCSRPGRARADRGGAHGAAHARRRPRRGLRVRALRLPHAGHRPGRAAGAALARTTPAAHGSRDADRLARGRPTAFGVVTGRPRARGTTPQRGAPYAEATRRHYRSCASFFSGCQSTGR